MATLVPSDQKKKASPPRDDSATTEGRLEKRIRLLESETKSLRDEVTSLRDELRQQDAETPRAVAYPVRSPSRSSPVEPPPPPPPPPPPARSGTWGTHRLGVAIRSVKATIAALATETSGIMDDLSWSITTEQNASRVYEISKCDFEDPSSRGLTKEQAARNMLVRKESLDEIQRTVATQLKEAKDRFASIRKGARPAVGGATVNEPGRDDDPIAAFQEICDVLKDFEGAAHSYEGSATDSEATDHQGRKRKEFQDSLGWCKFRLKKVQNAMDSHN